MEAILTADGKVELPADLREADDLRSGAKFLVERIAAGEYVLIKIPQRRKPVRIEEGPDGYPVIKSEGVITRKMVRRLEARLA